MTFKLKYILFLLVLVVIGCGPKKGIVTKKKTQKEKVEDKRTKDLDNTNNSRTKTTVPSSTEVYIQLYASIAKEEMRKYKIPASITLAQGILESGSGKGRLAVKANNHFGIKCHGWKGAKIYHDDDRSQECFRKYEKSESSYKDHSEFLTTRKRYSNLFRLRPDDYKGWARGLRAAGYATDRRYPEKLISLIERYQLYKYDNEVLNKSEDKTHGSITTAEKLTHIVVKGDTLYSLSKAYNTTVEAIKAQNNLNSNDLSIGQKLIIIIN